MIRLLPSTPVGLQAARLGIPLELWRLVDSVIKRGALQAPEEAVNLFPPGEVLPPPDVPLDDQTTAVLRCCLLLSVQLPIPLPLRALDYGVSYRHILDKLFWFRIRARVRVISIVQCPFHICRSFTCLYPVPMVSPIKYHAFDSFRSNMTLRLIT